MTSPAAQQVDQKLWLKILIGMGLGIALGLILSPHESGLNQQLMDMSTVTTFGEWIALPGIIFLGLLKMVVIPLVI